MTEVCLCAFIFGFICLCDWSRGRQSSHRTGLYLVFQVCRAPLVAYMHQEYIYDHSYKKSIYWNMKEKSYEKHELIGLDSFWVTLTNSVLHTPFIMSHEAKRAHGCTWMHMAYYMRCLSTEVFCCTCSLFPVNLQPTQGFSFTLLSSRGFSYTSFPSTNSFIFLNVFWNYLPLTSPSGFTSSMSCLLTGSWKIAITLSCYVTVLLFFQNVSNNGRKNKMK